MKNYCQIVHGKEWHVNNMQYTKNNPSTSSSQTFLHDILTHCSRFPPWHPHSFLTVSRWISPLFPHDFILMISRRISLQLSRIYIILDTIACQPPAVFPGLTVPFLFTLVHSNRLKSMKTACGDGIFPRQPKYRTVSPARARTYPNSNIPSIQIKYS